MKITRVITAVVLGLTMATATATAQAIHTIIYANTIADDIGQSVKLDVKRVKNEVSKIAQYIGYKTTWSIATSKDDCTKGALFSDLNSLQPQSDDIILFYYSGHGWRKGDDTDPFPRMCLTEDYEVNHPQVAEVRNVLKTKNARLKLIVTDCCNKDPYSRSFSRSYGKGATYSKDINYANYKKLFLETKGEIVITGSKPGQYSSCDDEVGGYLTYVLFSMIEEATKNAGTSNWNTILESTKKYLTDNTDQEPYYQLNGQSTTSQPSTPSSPVNQTVYPEDPQLAALFTNMITKSRSVDSRLALVNSALSKFTSDAEVITLGSDLKTIVDREPAEKFLKRICMSPNLVQINVVDQQLGYGGKKKLLVIHEIRTAMTY